MGPGTDKSHTGKHTEAHRSEEKCRKVENIQEQRKEGRKHTEAEKNEKNEKHKRKK